MIGATGRPDHVEFTLAAVPADPERLEHGLRARPGVVVARVVAAERRVLVGYDRRRTTPRELARALAALGAAPGRPEGPPLRIVAMRDACC